MMFCSTPEHSWMNTASLPYCFVMRVNSLAMMSSASSQLMRSYWPSPRFVPLDALHQVIQPVGASQPRADGAAAQASARLDGAERGSPCCRIRRTSFTVLHMALQRARASAVDMAVRPDDLRCQPPRHRLAERRRTGFGMPIALRRQARRARPSPSIRCGGSVPDVVGTCNPPPLVGFLASCVLASPRQRSAGHVHAVRTGENYRCFGVATLSPECCDISFPPGKKLSPYCRMAEFSPPFSA